MATAHSCVGTQHSDADTKDQVASLRLFYRKGEDPGFFFQDRIPLCKSWSSWNLLCRLAGLELKEILCLLSAGIKGLCHHHPGGGPIFLHFILCVSLKSKDNLRKLAFFFPYHMETWINYQAQLQVPLYLEPSCHLNRAHLSNITL